MLLSIVVAQKKQQHAAEDATQVESKEKHAFSAPLFHFFSFFPPLFFLIFHLGIDYHHY